MSSAMPSPMLLLHPVLSKAQPYACALHYMYCQKQTPKTHHGCSRRHDRQGDAQQQVQQGTQHAKWRQQDRRTSQDVQQRGAPAVHQTDSKCGLATLRHTCATSCRTTLRRHDICQARGQEGGTHPTSLTAHCSMTASAEAPPATERMSSSNEEIMYIARPLRHHLTRIDYIV